MCRNEYSSFPLIGKIAFHSIHMFSYHRFWKYLRETCCRDILQGKFVG